MNFNNGSFLNRSNFGQQHVPKRKKPSDVPSNGTSSSTVIASANSSPSSCSPHVSIELLSLDTTLDQETLDYLAKLETKLNEPLGNLDAPVELDAEVTVEVDPEKMDSIQTFLEGLSIEQDNILEGLPDVPDFTNIMFLTVLISSVDTNSVGLTSILDKYPENSKEYKAFKQKFESILNSSIFNYEDNVNLLAFLDFLV